MYSCVVTASRIVAIAIPLELNVRGGIRPHINSQSHNLSATPCLGQDYSLWPGSAQVVPLQNQIGSESNILAYWRTTA